MNKEELEQKAKEYLKKIKLLGVELKECPLNLEKEAILTTKIECYKMFLIELDSLPLTPSIDSVRIDEDGGKIVKPIGLYQALDKANEEYYNRNSNHYQDNERYSWAVETITSDPLYKEYQQAQTIKERLKSDKEKIERLENKKAEHLSFRMKFEKQLTQSQKELSDMREGIEEYKRTIEKLENALGY